MPAFKSASLLHQSAPIIIVKWLESKPKSLLPKADALLSASGPGLLARKPPPLLLSSPPLAFLSWSPILSPAPLISYTGTFIFWTIDILGEVLGFLARKPPLLSSLLSVGHQYFSHQHHRFPHKLCDWSLQSLIFWTGDIFGWNLQGFAKQNLTPYPRVFLTLVNQEVISVFTLFTISCTNHRWSILNILFGEKT